MNTDGLYEKDIAILITWLDPSTKEGLRRACRVALMSAKAQEDPRFSSAVAAIQRLVGASQMDRHA
jgi:hypothetical protein